jgi:hypothetical protein
MDRRGDGVGYGKSVTRERTMQTDISERLERLGLTDVASTLADAVRVVWLASVTHKHLWAWPYRTGETLENVFQVVFQFADGEHIHTVINVNEDWIWLDGVQARPIRTVVLDEAAASEFLDQVTRAMDAHSVRVWTWFGPRWIAFRAAHGDLHGQAASPTPPPHDHE